MGEMADDHLDRLYDEACENCGVAIVDCDCDCDCEDGCEECDSAYMDYQDWLWK